MLHGGQRCRSVALDGTEFCQHHDDVAAERGADAVKRGEHLPVRRKRQVQVPVVAQAPESATSGNGSGVDPASVRPRLAEAAAASLDDIRCVLVETATGANREMWATINCKHCGRAGRYEITVPDNKVRLDAVQALLHEALGRPGQAEAQPAPRMPSSVEAVEAMGWEEMQEVFAATYADEIAAAQQHGGKAVVREKLAVLSAGERRALREALDELELV